MKFSTPKLLKVQGEPGLVRDPNSNAILASDLGAKRQFLESQRREEFVRNAPERMRQLENIVATIAEKNQNLDTTLKQLQTTLENMQKAIEALLNMGNRLK
jgi:phage shock protein A